jgi:type VI secretion system secreted protein Hcp
MPSGALEIFLKLDGIQGESTAKGHEKEIVVLSYEQSITQSVTGPSGGGGAAGKAIFSGVRFRKQVDKASVPLLLACASGTHIKDARFTFCRGAAGLEFYKVNVKDVLATRVVQAAGTGAQYPLAFDALNAGADTQGFLDEVTLDYVTIEWEYQLFGSDGKPSGGPVKGGWDRKKNQKI